MAWRAWGLPAFSSSLQRFSVLRTLKRCFPPLLLISFQSVPFPPALGLDSDSDLDLTRMAAQKQRKLTGKKALYEERGPDDFDEAAAEIIL